MLTETFRTYGQAEPPVELIPLRAGPLALLYDPTSGMIRRIKLGEVEVLRGVYAAVRDRNWGTVPAVIREQKRVVLLDSFWVEFESEHRQDDVGFVWRGIIRGNADGSLRYEFDGEARTTFLRNRIGFCVLHPIRECAGARARQRRVDGMEVECRFPDLIEPQIFGRSSFHDLRGVAHEVTSGTWAQVEFEGDTFEMEDQRNWTDASFKTYCTPLALPFPVEVKAGTRIRQSVSLRLRSGPPEEEDGVDSRPSPPPHVSGCDEASGDPAIVTLTISDRPTGRLPAIGLGVASHGAPLSEAEIGALHQLRPAHLRVDVRLAAREAVATLERALREAAQLNCRLELALHLPREGAADAGALLRLLNQSPAAVARILALREGEPATSPATLAWVRNHFAALGALVGAGSDCNFCELNREHALGRLGLSDADFLFWSMNPQVHAFDHLSVMETLEAEPFTVRSARAFAGGRPLVVSPVTLKQRFNPVATGAAANVATGELPSQVDPRQLSDFAAAWSLGSIAALATAGVASATFYETTGARGVMECAAGSIWPAKFPSSAGGVFPVYQMFTELAGFQEFARVSSVAEDQVVGLALFAADRCQRVLFANLTGQTRSIRLVSPLVLSEIKLPPYAVLRTDASGGAQKIISSPVNSAMMLAQR